MNPEPAPKRPLSNLTIDDCRTLYEAAYGPTIRAVRSRYHQEGGHLTIHDCCFYLTIHVYGSLLASRRAQGSVFNDLCAGVNMYRLMRTIEQLNLLFGPVEVSPSTQAEL